MTRTNSIIVRDLESNLELISGVIKSIDTITPQVMIETKIIETDLNNNENLGIDWVLQASISGAPDTDDISFYAIQRTGLLGIGGQLIFPDLRASLLHQSSAPALTSSTNPQRIYLWDDQCFTAFRHPASF